MIHSYTSIVFIIYRSGLLALLTTTMTKSGGFNLLPRVLHWVTSLTPNVGRLARLFLHFIRRAYRPNYLSDSLFATGEVNNPGRSI